MNKQGVTCNIGPRGFIGWWFSRRVGCDPTGKEPLSPADSQRAEAGRQSRRVLRINAYQADTQENNHMAITLYGFKSCDMVRNAMKWLDANGVAYDFFDYRRDALDPRTLDDWLARAGWDTVFNRNSTTFKELPEGRKIGIDAKRARQMILEETNLIKRPVLDTGGSLLFGFKPDVWVMPSGAEIRAWANAASDCPDTRVTTSPSRK
jgi:Spx/MgsR family transcriptional regulator